MLKNIFLGHREVRRPNFGKTGDKYMTSPRQ